MRHLAIAWASASLLVPLVGCQGAALRALDRGTADLSRLDYAGAVRPLGRAAADDVEHATALEDHGIALAWAGHVDEGVGEIERATHLYPADDRVAQRQALYAIGRAWQSTRDCTKTRAGYAPFIAYASRFPGQSQNLSIARQNVAIVCKEPGAFSVGPDSQAASGPASTTTVPTEENPLGK